MPDERKKHISIPLNGKLITSEPAAIGQNFRTLTNIRYTDTHLKGVAGMTKINTSAITTYLKVRNAFHFRKAQPQETHLMCQGYNTELTASQVIQNTTAIPSAGAFSATALWTDSSGAGRGYFSDAPNGNIIYCNGVDACIWGGSEMRPGAFITSTAAIPASGVVVDPKDFTEQMQNTKDDADNVCIVGTGGIDTYTVLALHGDEVDGTGGVDGIQDSSASDHTITAVGGAVTDDAQAKFGLGSIYFDGTDDYLTAPDHANWYFGADPFTIDTWVRFSKLIGQQGICGQYVDADNFWYLKISPSAILSEFYIKSGGVVKAYYLWTLPLMAVNTWYHIELVRTGTNVYLFINGVSRPTYGSITLISTNEVPNLAAVLEVGASKNHTTFFKGWIDEFRISKGVARHTANFTPSDKAYISTSSLYWLIGSPRPLQGVKYYISEGNVEASTLTGSYWNGTSWQTHTLTDNTDTGASLAATGTVTFSTTVDVAKPSFIEGYFLYWYQFYLDAGNATLYKVTIDAPFQGITDLWDGTYRDVSAAYKRYVNQILNITLGVLRDDYDADTPDTYANLSSLPAFGTPTNCLEIGFPERMTGLKFMLPPEYVNSTAATTMAIDYWNGEEYVSVGTITDNTSTDAVSFGKSGTVTWNNTNLTDEVKNNSLESIAGRYERKGGTWASQQTAIPLYFYRVRFDKAMDANVRLNYIGGITASKEVSYYKFPIFAQNRVLLCADMSGKKNKIVCSGKNTPQVYNGEDSVDIYFGDENELNCGTELYSQYAGNLYSLVLMFKDNESWIMAGQDIDQWEANIFPLSNTIGCPAPQTLKTVNLAAEPGQGINRNLAIWQGTNGIYMSDGRAPIPIHGDIKEYFDKTNSSCIKASMVGESVGFIDPEKQEYHWIFASGTSTTTLNKELVYDIHRNKWFEIDRGSGLDLQCGVLVQDTYGNTYTYGFIDTGYCERLEYGSDFDGTDITHTFQTGDFAPMGLEYSTQLDHLKLISVAKTTADTDVTLTHYLNTSTTGTDKTLSLVNTGYRLARPAFAEKLVGEPFHSIKMAITTDDATCGFEPLAIVATFHVVQSD